MGLHQVELKTDVLTLFLPIKKKEIKEKVDPLGQPFFLHASFQTKWDEQSVLLL